MHHTMSLMQPAVRSRRAALGVGVMFFSNGTILASLLPWYPTLVAQLQLDAATFGVIVASFAVGSIASSALPAPLIGRFGPTRVAVVGTVLLASAIASVGFVDSGLLLAGAIFLAGFCDAVVDVSQNVAGVRVQHRAGRAILSSMHALWSLGGVLGGATATAAAASGVDIRIAIIVLPALGIVAVCIGAWLTRGVAEEDLPQDPAVAPHSTRGARLRAVIALALPLAIIAICGTMVEDVANNWAALTGATLGGLDAAAAGIVFTVAIGSQCVGRFLGDVMMQRLGAAAVARLGGALIAMGGLLLVIIPGPVTVLIAFALVGFGSATLTPSAFGAAARIPGLSDGAGVTLINWLMRVGFLVTSPLIGGISAVFGLQAALGLLVVIGVTAVFLAGALSPDTATDNGGAPTE